METRDFFPLNVDKNPRTCAVATVAFVGVRVVVVAIVLGTWLVVTFGWARATFFWDTEPEWVFLPFVAYFAWKDLALRLADGPVQDPAAFGRELARGVAKDGVWLLVVLGLFELIRRHLPYTSAWPHLAVLLVVGVVGWLVSTFLLGMYRATVSRRPEFHGPVIRGRTLGKLDELQGGEEGHRRPPLQRVFDDLLRRLRGRKAGASPRAEPVSRAGGSGEARPRADGYPWGGLLLAPTALEPHYAVMGTTGSGKTLTILMLMNRVLGLSDSRPTCRAVVYDPKVEMFPLLRGMGIPEDRIVVLHPFDARSAAWDIAADIYDHTTTEQMAGILIPRDKRDVQPFFNDAARHLVSGVMRALGRDGRRDWTLNDVVESVTSISRLKEILSLTADGRDLVENYLAPNTATTSSILTTLQTKISPFTTVARMWARTPKTVSLQRWFEDPTPRVLLLATDDKNSEALNPINKAIFLRVSQLVTGREGQGKDETWVFMDELALAGELDGLSTLLLKGRSKGAHVVVGFQDIEGLKDVYRQGAASEMIGQCGNMAVLRLNSPETAAWASRLFGEYEYHRYTFSHSSGPGGPTSGINWSNEKREAILPAEFQQFPLTRKGAGMMGAFSTPTRGAWTGLVPQAFLDAHLPGRTDDAAFVGRKAACQAPLPWSSADRKRLGLPPPAVAVAPSPKEEEPKRKTLRVPKGVEDEGHRERGH